MHPSFVVVALTALLSPMSGSASPSWLKDYGAARQQGRDEQKPVCVIIGSGKAGWVQLSQEGRLSADAKRLLADNYVCLYVDTEHIAGRELAASFEIDGPGIVISDGTGEVQAFRHEGDLPNDRLVQYLRRFADPDRVATATETNPAPVVSYYEPPAAPVYAPVYPVSFAPAMGGFCST